MKKNNCIAIIGCSIPSLYAGIKCLTMGYSVTIYEKQSQTVHSDTLSRQNLKIFNENHISYIELLKSYQIQYEKISGIKYNSDLFNFMSIVMQRSKAIPNNILVSQTMTGLCANLMINIDFIKHDNTFDYIFDKISAFECINIFKNDFIEDINYYHLKRNDIDYLLKKMCGRFESNGGKIIYDSQVTNVRYVKRKFNLMINNSIYYSDILLTTISKMNLLLFGFWNSEQRMLLNATQGVPTSNISTMMDKIIKLPDNISILDEFTDVNHMLLNDLHIVYPIIANKHKMTYIWNININNVLVSEKIKHMYNERFLICSESFSKNNMFVNYSFEYVNNTLNTLYHNIKQI